MVDRVRQIRTIALQQESGCHRLKVFRLSNEWRVHMHKGQIHIGELLLLVLAGSVCLCPSSWGQVTVSDPLTKEKITSALFKRYDPANGCALWNPKPSDPEAIRIVMAQTGDANRTVYTCVEWLKFYHEGGEDRAVVMWLTIPELGFSCRGCVPVPGLSFLSKAGAKWIVDAHDSAFLSWGRDWGKGPDAEFVKIGPDKHAVFIHYNATRRRNDFSAAGTDRKDLIVVEKNGELFNMFEAGWEEGDGERLYSFEPGRNPVYFNLRLKTTRRYKGKQIPVNHVFEVTDGTYQ